MKLVSFSIKNYKSSLDLGTCEIDESVTVLAGKNESGKTNILEALNKLNKGQSFKENEKTLGSESDPEVFAIFSLDSTDVESITSAITKETPTIVFSPEQIEGLKKQPHISITKTKEKNLIGGENWEGLKKIITKSLKDFIKRLSDIEQMFAGANVKLFDGEEDHLTVDDTKEQLTTKFQKFLKMAKSNIPAIIESQSQIDEMLNALQQSFVEVNKVPEISVILNHYIVAMPTIVLFKSFDEEKLKDSLTIQEAKENQFAKDLGAIKPEFNIEEIEKKQDDEFWIQNFEETFSATLTQDFMDYWDFDQKDKISRVDIKVRIANKKITFFVSNPNTKKQFFPSQRSKGFQWFLSFYTRILSSAADVKSQIILIDEPGLFLHAKSQQSVLKILNRLAGKSQIIYATHSPYLIEEDKLQRIRLVECNDKGYTKIVNKFYDTKDQDTLTPILTAIGHDIFTGIAFDEKKNNVIVEGISDYLILLSMIKYLKFSMKNKLYFIPMRGADSILKYIPFFIAWNLKFLTLLDSDEKGKTIEKDLIETWAISKNQIFKVSSMEDHSIEDLFAHEEYFKNLLEKNSFNPKVLISQQLNSSQKVIAAKNLQRKIEEKKMVLSKETCDKFQLLLESIDSYFN